MGSAQDMIAAISDGDQAIAKKLRKHWADA